MWGLEKLNALPMITEFEMTKSAPEPHWLPHRSEYYYSELRRKITKQTII